MSKITGSATLEVKYTIKRVRSTTKEVRGELVVDGETGRFDLSIPILSFLSSDTDFDQHMREVTEVKLYPIARGTGEILKSALATKKSTVDVLIDFHGVKKHYPVQLENNGALASFTIDLEAHKIKRPSMLGIKIKNEVLMSFDLNWGA